MRSARIHLIGQTEHAIAQEQGSMFPVVISVPTEKGERENDI